MIKDLIEIQKIVSLSELEKAWFDDKRSSLLEFGISDNILPLLAHTSIRRQFIPLVSELNFFSRSLDPLEEVKNLSFSRLIHRYKNRVALLITDKCFAYCRHCFRRRFTSNSCGLISEKEIDEACKYLENNRQITEILLTGGDPLTASNEELLDIIKKIRKANRDIVIRLCTRSLFSNPERIDDKLCDILHSFNLVSPLFLLVQFNHPLEFTSSTISAIQRVREAGIAIFNQSVLLKGVNDTLEVQCNLAHELLHRGIKPYYVFLPDRVAGTSHFRVDVKTAIEIERKMRIELSGLEMPTFAIDLPESGGKIPLHFNYIKKLSKKEGKSIFLTPEGEKRNY